MISDAKAEALIRLLIAEGYTTDEIVDKFRVDGLAPTGHDRRHVAELIAAQRPHGQPPSLGRTADQVIDAIAARREPDGTMPTQAAVAEALGCSDRYVRHLVGPVGGWKAALALAETRSVEG